MSTIKHYIIRANAIKSTCLSNPHRGIAFESDYKMGWLYKISCIESEIKINFDQLNLIGSNFNFAVDETEEFWLKIIASTPVNSTQATIELSALIAEPLGSPYIFIYQLSW